MPAITVTTANAVVKHIQQLLPDVECQRSYLPTLEAEQLAAIGKPIVYVVPVDRETETINQGGGKRNKLTFDIAVNAKLTHRNDEPAAQLAEIDPLIEIAETLYDEFTKKVVITDEPVRVTANQPEQIMLSDFEAIAERNCFLSVIRINVETYKK